jgi:FKBP-type peptidyl-prolyl cis-trans isomerase (trigger factor)
MIGKLFWEQAEVKTYDELRAYIKNEILKQKQDSELIKTIEDYLNDIRKAWLNVIIPETIINQEFNTRMQNLKERFGSQEKVSEYFKQLWEEKSKAFVEEVKKAATESLEKFFILNKVTEHLWIKIDWTSKDQDNLFVEKEIYNKLVWELPNAEGKKEQAKKATKKATKKEEK